MINSLISLGKCFSNDSWAFSRSKQRNTKSFSFTFRTGKVCYTHSGISAICTELYQYFSEDGIIVWPAYRSISYLLYLVMISFSNCSNCSEFSWYPYSLCSFTTESSLATPDFWYCATSKLRLTNHHILSARFQYSAAFFLKHCAIYKL